MAKAKKRIASKKASKRGKARVKAYAHEGSKARDAEKATTEDRGKNGTKKSVKTRRAGHRRHDHRRGRRAGPRRGPCYGVRNDQDDDSQAWYRP
jgi:hypothetical protein